MGQYPPAREYGTRPAGTCADCGGEVTYTTTPSMGYLVCKGTCGKSSLRGQSPPGCARYGARVTPREVEALALCFREVPVRSGVPVRRGYAPIPRAAAESPAGWYPAGERCPWWTDLRNVSSEWFCYHVETLIGLRPAQVTYHGATFALGEDPAALRKAYACALEMAEGYTLLHGARSYPARWWANVTASLFDAYRTEGSTQRIR